MNEETHILEKESLKFKEYYLWLQRAMPEQFFQEIDQDNLLLIAHNMMKFDSQEYVASIHLKHMAIIICLDQPDADMQVLKNYATFGIQSYQMYVAKEAAPFLKTPYHIRVVLIQFFSLDAKQAKLDETKTKAIRAAVEARNPKITDEEFNHAIQEINVSFLRDLSVDQLAIAIAMYHRATTRDHCQYEVHYNEDWEATKQPSMQITLAWRNTPKHNFLFRLVRVVHRYGLVIKDISASHEHLYSPNSILLLALDLDGQNNQAAWNIENIQNFIKELITVKYFASFDAIDHYFVSKGLITGDMGNFLRAAVNFIHQSLVHVDINIYSLDHIKEGLCRHPELTIQLCEAFAYRFDPGLYDEKKYLEVRENLLSDIEKLDTGHEENDIRRKNILRQGLSFIHHTWKTNFYRPNYTALSFRLNPAYLDDIPFDRSKKFPELPYAIIFIKGMHFIGFHIRFKDLARGGLRTVYPEHAERMEIEQNSVFTECYNLAYTQQMKNKDIPEGGAKAIIFMKPHDRLESETLVYRKDLQRTDKNTQEIDHLVTMFRQEQMTEHLYQAQRSFIENLLTIINCDSEGRLRAKDIVDYWQKPEYLYLGPDENMHNSMIEWIARYSKKCRYKPGTSFISGKPNVGINHKEYGVTSLGLNVYLEMILHAALGINPFTTPFTIKMSGGPDGDVAGNEICNLHRYYPETAKLVALTDVSGTIFDPDGLDLSELVTLFKEAKSIRFYPPEKLHKGGFLVDKMTKRYQTSLVQQTLCWRRSETALEQEWLSGSDMNYLVRHNLHQTHADVFIPAGGRPRTLNESNYTEFLDPTGKPTARLIIEGANLYLTQRARRALEELGVLIVKDSSANKTGVICSSFEVLSGLTLGDDKFVAYKPTLVKEIMERLKACAANEAALLLRTHRDENLPFTEISETISKRINFFFDQVLDYLDTVTLSNDPKDPLMRCYLSYCLPLLREHFQTELIRDIPDLHKKAIIACHIAAHLVYNKGLKWFPSLVDILPDILK